jgi:hypothetical protein
MNRWLPTSDIPNEEGFNVRVLMRNGEQRNTTVVWSHGAQMFHLNGISVADVRGWTPMETSE